MTSRNPIPIPPAIQDIIDDEAAKENRSPVEVLTDAVEQYHRSKMLAALGGYGQQRSRELGLQPSDVEEAIAEDRYQRDANSGGDTRAGGMLAWRAVEERLYAAKAKFLENDKLLLQSNANERSMTHKFAEYLQAEFVGWDVDCEYNRNGSDVKRLKVNERTIPTTDLDAQTVYPDIIVHCRNKKRNLLVIEAKKSRNNTNLDRDKLCRFRSDPLFNYEFAVLLVFETDTQDVTIEQCCTDIELLREGLIEIPLEPGEEVADFFGAA